MLLFRISTCVLCFKCRLSLSAWRETSAIPELWVKSEAEAATDASCSPLPLEGAGFGDKGLNQGTHLTALMVPE